jgi:hypothetical protein
VQDDKEEVKREIRKMSDIYMRAFVTISAATASHSDEGFLQKCKLSECYVAIYELPFRGPKGIFGSIFSSEGSINSSDEEESDLRAWKMQKHMLPLRLLRYGSRQVEWKCLQEHGANGGTVYDEFPPDETYFHGSPFQADFIRPAVGESGRFDVNRTLDNWVHVVEKFSRRDITNLADRLPAIAAITEQFALVLQFESADYLAGIWKQGFPFQLLWHKPASHERESLSLVFERGSPTWPWHSIKFEISFPMKFEPENCLEILDCEIDLESQVSKYGQVRQGLLSVRGYLQKVILTCGSFIYVHPGDLDAIASITAFWDTQSDVQTPMSVYLLEVESFWSSGWISKGLILTQVNNITFRRVGYFESNIPKSKVDRSNVLVTRKSNWLHELQRRIITLI